MLSPNAQTGIVLTAIGAVAGAALWYGRSAPSAAPTAVQGSTAPGPCAFCQCNGTVVPCPNTAPGAPAVPGGQVCGYCQDASGGAIVPCALPPA